jgi:hypothetical protein
VLLGWADVTGILVNICPGCAMLCSTKRTISRYTLPSLA